jgi:MFS family permease
MATPSESTAPLPGLNPSPNGQRHATPDVYIYLATLLLFFTIPGSVVYTPLQFLYMNQLHMPPHETVIFKFVINIPGMLAFLMGILRDRYNPLKMGDRGFLLFGGIAVAAIYLAMASVRMTVFTLGTALILSGIAGGFIGAAFNALMRNISEARMMTGRMSTLNNFMGAAVPAVFMFIGGWFTDHLTWRMIFVFVAGCYTCLALLGFWKPSGVFEGIPSGGDRNFSDLARDAKLLLRHRGFWWAIMINAVWQFTPAANTPLTYFLTHNLKMTGTQFGLFNTIGGLAVIPIYLAFGSLCKRVSLWRLLLVSSAVAIPQWFPVMYIHTPNQAYALSVFSSTVGGLATAAYFALLLRACPKNLAGTGMLLNSGISLLLIEAGNVLGGFLYDKWGFSACAWVTTGAYCLLLPMCFLLPRALVDPPDDKPVPTEEELVAA